MRRLLAVVLLALTGLAGLVVLGAPAQAACPTGRGSTAAHAKDADVVMTGTVESRRRSANTVTYAVTADRFYKGPVDEEEVSVYTDARPGRCGLPDLQTGKAYVFFARTTGSGISIDGNGGTTRATDDAVAKVEDVLGSGRSVTPPEPIEATFTMVAGDPVHLRRVAAPGVALVIVGLLGFALAAWRGRRSA